MIKISISAYAPSNALVDFRPVVAKSTKHWDDLIRLLEDAEYGDASALVELDAEKYGSKLTKQVIELNLLSDVAPKEIFSRKESDILALVKELKG